MNCLKIIFECLLISLINDEFEARGGGRGRATGWGRRHHSRFSSTGHSSLTSTGSSKSIPTSNGDQINLPPVHARYIPKNKPPLSLDKTPHSPSFTPSVGYNPYSPNIIMSSVPYGYGYNYLYSKSTVIYNHQYLHEDYPQTNNSDFLTAYTYYNLERLSNGNYDDHNIYTNDYIKIEAVIDKSNATNIPRTVNLYKTKLFESILVPFDKISKHKIDYKPIFLNESIENASIYGIDYLTWSEFNTVPKPHKTTKSEEVTGLGEKIGNWFFSIVSWFSETSKNENKDIHAVHNTEDYDYIVMATALKSISIEKLKI